MVAHPQLRFQMGESRTRKRIVGGEEEEEVEERRGGRSLRTCHVKLFWTNSNTARQRSPKSIGEWSQSARRKRWKSSLLISTDWNVSLSPAPSGNRSRILSLLFLIAQEDFLGRGFGQWTRWTRSRTHVGGTNRTPYSSFAALTRWVSCSMLDRGLFFFFFFFSFFLPLVRGDAARGPNVKGRGDKQRRVVCAWCFCWSTARSYSMCQLRVSFGTERWRSAWSFACYHSAVGSYFSAKHCSEL